MTSPPARHQFSAEQIAQLLAELDRRLQARGIAASIFIVGGAAVAAGARPHDKPGEQGDARRDRLTADVDALTHDRVVLDEARALARERGLPEHWLNTNANMWMPPLPLDALEHPRQPGLRVTYADDGFLLANKLLAQRAKDADDVVALAEGLGLDSATPEQLEAHIRSYYTDTEMLEFIVGGNDVDREIDLLAHEASAMLTARSADGHPAPEPAEQTDTPPSTDLGRGRLERTVHLEQRRPPSMPGDTRPRRPRR